MAVAVIYDDDDDDELNGCFNASILQLNPHCSVLGGFTGFNLDGLGECSGL